MKYRVILVEKDSTEHPEMVKYVHDDERLFVVNERGNFWPADGFFFMVNVDSFEVPE